MNKLLLCLSLFFALSSPVIAQDVTGQWQGVIKTPNKDLRVIAKVAKDDTRLQTTLYSIDQQAPRLRLPPLDSRVVC